MSNFALQEELIDTLMEVPLTETYSGRSSLLRGISVQLNRTEFNPRSVDLHIIVTQLEQVGRIVSTGARPLIMVAEKASKAVKGTELERRLRNLIQALEDYYGGEPPAPTLPSPEGGDALDGNEILIFKGQDERLPFHWLREGERRAASVARLRVPCLFQQEDGSFRESDEFGYGTGWLVAPHLLLTNNHVLTARDTGGEHPQPVATDAEVEAQACRLVAWFDYHTEGGTHDEYHVQEGGLLHRNAALDYALLRLEEPSPLQQERGYLPLVARRAEPARGARLNIIQYPRGGSLKFAIRNNFYYGTGETPDHLRYLTDTEHGASGSPVLNDAWQVVAIHHAYRKLEWPEHYQGEPIDYLNQGIDIHAILQDLPEDLRSEVVEAQRRLSQTE